MKPDCLFDRDLILLYYHETPDGMTADQAANHLIGCPDCQARRERLAADLAALPATIDPDPIATTRIVARVSERLNQRRRWLPLAGAAVVGAMALAMAVIVWLPGPQAVIPGSQPQLANTRPATTSNPQIPIRQAALDLELLEQLDLLEELETLQAIEGV